VRQSDGAESFAACGQRRGLLALDLGSIFKKLLHQKTFILLRSAQVTKIDIHALIVIIFRKEGDIACGNKIIKKI
jgi:hypothetical protein